MFAQPDYYEERRKNTIAQQASIMDALAKMAAVKQPSELDNLIKIQRLEASQDPYAPQSNVQTPFSQNPQERISKIHWFI